MISFYYCLIFTLCACIRYKSTGICVSSHALWYILTHTYYTVTVSVQVSPSPWPINGHLYSPSYVRLIFNTVPASWHKQELQNWWCTSCIGRSGSKFCAFFHLQRNTTDLAYTRTAIYSINKVNVCNHYSMIQRRYTYAILKDTGEILTASYYLLLRRGHQYIKIWDTTLCSCVWCEFHCWRQFRYASTTYENHYDDLVRYFQNIYTTDLDIEQAQCGLVTEQHRIENYTLNNIEMHRSYDALMVYAKICKNE